MNDIRLPTTTYDHPMIHGRARSRSPLAYARTWLRRGLGFLSLALLTLSVVQSVATAQPGTAASAPLAIPAARAAKNVAIITVDREIDATMARSVKRRLEAAASAGADAILFELNTPGGEVGAVLEICEAIKNSPVPNTVAWIHTKAYSGGAIIALACREIVTSDVARFGDAAPIRIGSTPVGRGIVPIADTERAKILAPLLTEIVDSARRRGYDEKLLQGLVTLGVELWLVQNPTTGERLFIDRSEHELLFGAPPATEPLAIASGGAAPASSTPPSDPQPTPLAASPTAPRSEKDFVPASPRITPDLARTVSGLQDRSSTRPILTEADRGKWVKIEKVSDGSAIFTFTEGQLTRYGLASHTVRGDTDVKTFFGASNLVQLDESWSERLVLFLSNRLVQGFLVVVFLVAMFIEMTHPGVILPGAIAAVALVTLIIPPFLNNMASWWEIVAILVGIVLIAMEMFVLPGFGVAGITGLVLLLFGLVGIFVGGSGSLFPGAPSPRGDMLSAVTTLLISLATAGVTIFFLARHLGSIPILGKLVLHADASSQGDDGLLAAMDPAAGFPVQIGDQGVAITPLRPAGRVQVGDRIIDVVSDLGFIDAGANVRIATVDEFRITVERA